jgi:hypothetical protein
LGGKHNTHPKEHHDSDQLFHGTQTLRLVVFIGEMHGRKRARELQSLSLLARIGIPINPN